MQDADIERDRVLEELVALKCEYSRHASEQNFRLSGISALKAPSDEDLSNERADFDHAKSLLARFATAAARYPAARRKLATTMVVERQPRRWFGLKPRHDTVLSEIEVPPDSGSALRNARFLDLLSSLSDAVATRRRELSRRSEDCKLAAVAVANSLRLMPDDVDWTPADHEVSVLEHLASRIDLACDEHAVAGRAIDEVSDGFKRSVKAEDD